MNFQVKNLGKGKPGWSINKHLGKKYEILSNTQTPE